MSLKIVEGDLLDQDVEVIVNVWNRNIIVLAAPLIGAGTAARKRSGFWQ